MPVLVLGSKYDMEAQSAGGCHLSSEEIYDHMESVLGPREFRVQMCSGITGDGVREAQEFMAKHAHTHRNSE